MDKESPKVSTGTDLTTTRKVSTTVTDKAVESKEPPKGATITNKTITTTTEQIENGFLVCKNYDISWTMGKNGNSGYSYYSKKWYTKTDPLEVKLTDKSLADAFDEK